MSNNLIEAVDDIIYYDMIIYFNIYIGKLKKKLPHYILRLTKASIDLDALNVCNHHFLPFIRRKNRSIEKPHFK